MNIYFLLCGFRKQPKEINVSLDQRTTSDLQLCLDNYWQSLFNQYILAQCQNVVATRENEQNGNRFNRFHPGREQSCYRRRESDREREMFEKRTLFLFFRYEEERGLSPSSGSLDASWSFQSSSAVGARGSLRSLRSWGSWGPRRSLTARSTSDHWHRLRPELPLLPSAERNT